MIPKIGCQYIYKGKECHCQDVDHIKQIAKIGVPDENGIVWNWVWADFDWLSPVKVIATDRQRIP